MGHRRKKGNSTKPAAKPSPAAPAAQGSLAKTIAEWAVTVLVYLFASTTLVQGFVIPTGSMENTLLVGDHLFVDKLAYSPSDGLSRGLLPYRDIERGDIVVFRYPLDLDETYVKRAVGLPGDRLRIAGRRLIVNGVEMAEPYVVHKTNLLDSYRDYFPSEPNLALPPEGLDMLKEHVRNGEIVVPRGQYFVLGDNRDNSEDSRYWGFVPRENIIGKPWFIYWSYEAPTEYLVAPGIQLDYLLDLSRNFFTKTRWRRTFQMVRASGE
jgi:signal peptidase I